MTLIVDAAFVSLDGCSVVLIFVCCGHEKAPLGGNEKAPLGGAYEKRGNLTMAHVMRRLGVRPSGIMPLGIRPIRSQAGSCGGA